LADLIALFWVKPNHSVRGGKEVERNQKAWQSKEEARLYFYGVCLSRKEEQDFLTD
jgi:hypothetical protein